VIPDAETETNVVREAGVEPVEFGAGAVMHDEQGAVAVSKCRVGKPP
jgi:hypothetical protein